MPCTEKFLVPCTVVVIRGGVSPGGMGVSGVGGEPRAVLFRYHRLPNWHFLSDSPKLDQLPFWHDAWSIQPQAGSKTLAFV